LEIEYFFYFRVLAFYVLLHFCVEKPPETAVSKSYRAVSSLLDVEGQVKWSGQRVLQRGETGLRGRLATESATPASFPEI